MKTIIFNRFIGRSYFHTMIVTIISMALLHHLSFAQPGLFQLINSVQVTPDSMFSKAGFVRLGYIPATNSIVATFGSHFVHPLTTDSEGHGFKEYTLNMIPTGKSGELNNEKSDCNGLIVDSLYFDASVDPSGGWRIMKFNTLTWAKINDIVFPLDTPGEANGDMMIAFVNGQLDISSQIGRPEEDAGTHHEFFSPNLEFLEKKIFSDTPHICGSSMIYVDSIYYFITATDYTGDVILMKYDKEWKYLGSKKLISQAHWSEGLAWDGLRFYVVYLNTSLRTEPHFWPYYPNVHLAAFDKDWNLIDDIAVTSYTSTDSMFTGRPSLLLIGNKLYVSYDAVPLPEDLTKIEGYVKVYEIHPSSTSIGETQTRPNKFQLEQNYPNPFNPSTTITFTLPEASNVKLGVYNMLGQKVATLVDRKMNAGVQSVVFDARELCSGVYFYRLEAGSFISQKRMLLIK